MEINTKEYGILETEKGFETNAMSTFIKTEEIGKIGDKVKAIIIDVKEVPFSDGNKIVLDLAVDDVEDEKSIGLNKTNLCTMINEFGKETSKWKKKEILLKVEEVEYDNKPIPATRIYPA